MISIDQQIAEAQAEWDKATNAYSRYPGGEEWKAFLDAKKKVEYLQNIKQSLTNLKTRQACVTNIGASTPEKILSFLKTVSESNYADIIKQCHLTKDQVRHALLKLLKDKRIEKVKQGWYKIRGGD